MLAHQQDVGGVAGGQRQGAQVLGLEVVQVGLAGAARHHRGLAAARLDDVGERRGALRFAVVGGEATVHRRRVSLSSNAGAGYHNRQVLWVDLHLGCDNLNAPLARSRLVDDNAFNVVNMVEAPSVVEIVT